MISLNHIHVDKEKMKYTNQRKGGKDGDILLTATVGKRLAYVLLVGRSSWTTLYVFDSFFHPTALLRLIQYGLTASLVQGEV